MEEQRNKNQKELFEAAFPKEKSGYKFEKEINKFTTNKNIDNIDAKGENRQIIVKGTPGSIFSITLEDSAGCNMLANKIQNKKIPSIGTYTFSQIFPSIKSNGQDIKTKETYSLKITVGADVRKAVNDIVLEQIADPVITITKTTSQTGPALSVSGSDITFTGSSMSRVNVKPKTFTLTITGSAEDTSESLYVKNTNFRENVTTNSVIQKVVDCAGETKPKETAELILKPLTSITETTIEGVTTVTHDIQPGSTVSGIVYEQKTLLANLDKNENIIDYSCDNTLPVKHRLNNTTGIDVGMKVIGKLIEGTIVKSIDCNQNITLSPPQVIEKDSAISFVRSVDSTVAEVVDNNRNGKAVVILNKAITVNDNMVLDFDNNKNGIHGEINFDNSGVDSITLKAFIKPVRFGDKNVTYTLDLDNIITSKPNAYNRSVKTKENTAIVINMIKNDTDANASIKTSTITGNPSHGSVARSDSGRTYTYTPNNGFTGKDQFKFTMSDGVNSADEKTVFIDVGGVDVVAGGSSGGSSISGGGGGGY